MNPMGVFGGTFDPIHYGHLRTAFELLQELRLSEVRFMPCGTPPHRGTPIADAELRVRMVELATEAQHGFVVDDRELQREGPSYSVDTLAALRAEYPTRSLCLIVGMDAFRFVASNGDYVSPSAEVTVSVTAGSRSSMATGRWGT